MDKITNKEFLEQDQIFKRACELVQLPPTKRQASKFRNKKGKAFKGLKILPLDK